MDDDADNDTAGEDTTDEDEEDIEDLLEPRENYRLLSIPSSRGRLRNISAGRHAVT